ncbi:MAG TPA: hypothetical protein DCY13_10505 [Verrucomicrobiales bacterium]|nr:hypothetical protein [Verrucomicrobiales bacterium]
MAEIAKFVNRNAQQITPNMVARVMRDLPMWKAEFTQINAPKYPHLIDQLEFLADAVEDCFEGIYRDLPYVALAEAVFALMYTHKQVGIIPDFIPSAGHADDSSVVRAVLIQNKQHFQLYAAHQGRDWHLITSQP